MAARAKPEWQAAVVDLAWILATAPDPRARANVEAVELAERAVRLSQRADPVALNVLGVAYAPAGLFDQAIAAATAALEAGAAGSLAEEITTRRRRYEQRQPYRPIR